jgi:hypothetical protein
MRGDRLALTLLIAAAWSVPCSTPPSPSGPAVISAPVTASPTTNPVRSVEMCVGTPPAAWTSGFQAQSVVLPSGTRFGLGAPALAGQVAFGQFDNGSEDGIGSLDLATGRMTRIVSWTTPVSGMGWMSVELPWLVWEQGNSQANLSDWSVLAWNKDTGARSTIATSRLADGTFLFGQPPIPSIRNGIVTWAQPLPRRGDVNESEIHAFDLTTRRDIVLASGRVGAPVFAGRYLIWGRRESDGRYSFQAVDAKSFAAIDLPDRLRDPGPIAYVAGSSRFLAWSGDSSQSVTVWTVDSSAFVEYRSPDLTHSFQFPQLAGHFLLFYGGVASSILDLTTGAAFDVAGSLAGSDERIAKEEPSGPVGQKGQLVSSRISAVSLNAVGTISTCTPR